MSTANPVIEKPGLGRVSVVETGEGDKVTTQFTVVDAPDLVVSNMGDGAINPDYPQELQPRDRTSLSSKMQVLNISKDLQPENLADNPFSGKGAPIIGPDNVVESGNGRTLGIVRAYGSGQADHYRDWIIKNAKDYGLDPEVVASMRAPVLVRVRTDDIDRVQFAIDSNKDVKSAVPDKAMLEGADEKNYFAEATNMDELINMVKFRGYDDVVFLGKAVSSWLAKLVKGELTRAAYLSKINSMIPSGSTLREGISEGRSPEFFYGLSEGPLVFSARNAAIGEHIILGGEVGNILSLAQQWAKGGDDKKAIAVQLKAIYSQAAQWSNEQKPNLYFFQFWAAATAGLLTREVFEDVLALVNGTARKLRGEEFQAAHDDATAEGVALLNTRESKQKSSLMLQTGAAKLMRELADDRSNLHQNLYRATDEQYLEYIKRVGEALIHGRMGHHSAKVEGISNIARQFSAQGKQAIRRTIEIACTPLQNRIYSATSDIIDKQPAAPDVIDSLFHGITIHPSVKANCDAKWGEGILEAVIKFSLRLAGGKISTLTNIIPARSGERSSASKFEKCIRMASNSAPDVLAHEIGHHFEFSNDNLPGLAQEYLRSRMSSKRLRTLKSLCPGYNYKRDEKAIEDKLSEPYIGKVYGGDLSYATSTEVYSMAFQYMWDQESGAQSVMNNDGLLEFVMGVIKGVHSGKY
ncbi:hypothetical protein QMM96_22560 [Citrobacter freundii]|uniref:hypothetical protein n=1 Tax=Citrobacter freundii TaxID=546 RepID=UPI002B241CF4|nr:hypothetical protein [Citrobacter freundii]MEB2478216.1 hypothetical protein [Citrobacter freundii]